VSADTVVEHFNVFKQSLTGLGSGLILLVVDQFFLQRRKERFQSALINFESATALF